MLLGSQLRLKHIFLENYMNSKGTLSTSGQSKFQVCDQILVEGESHFPVCGSDR